MAAGLLAAGLLAACSPGSAPQLIGSYPRSGVPAPPADIRVVYTAYLTLEVRDVDLAITQAADYAVAYGGYLAESRAWYQNDRKYASVTLAVPAPNFDRLRQAVLGLGTLLSESISGQPRPIGGDDWRTFTHITLDLQPAPAAIPLPPLPAPGWDPGRTLARALGVSYAIFGFVVDILIWVLVVGGPFVFLAWLARWAWRRSRAHRP
jgi:hypothetical protein